jgi:hypothetical protein
MKGLSLVLALAFFVLTLLYWTGHGPLSGTPGVVHVKHGVVTLVLAVLALIWWRFLSNAEPRRGAGPAR